MKLERITWGLLFTVLGKFQTWCLGERTALSAAERCYVRGGVGLLECDAVFGLLVSDVSEERYVIILRGL